MNNTQCVIQTEHGLGRVVYEYFKQSGDERTVLFIGTQQECLDFIARSNAAQETYTREEVYLVAQRSIENFMHNWLTNNNKTSDEIINSEIDTVKLF